MQSYPRCQPPSQSLKLMRTLPPEAEGVEELVINRLHDLAYSGNPPPQRLGPAALFGVPLGRVNNLRPVAFEPTPMILGALETLVGYVRTTAERADATQSLGFGRALTAKKVSARVWSALEAQPTQKPVITPVGSTAVSKEKPSYNPMLLDHPMSSCPSSHPCPRRLASLTGIPYLSRAW